MTRGRGTFVLSSGRCGSTYFGSLLSDEEAVVYPELLVSLQPNAFPDGDLTGEQLVAYLFTPRPLANFMIANGLTTPEMAGVGSWAAGAPVRPLMVATAPSLSATPDEMCDALRFACHRRQRSSISSHLSWVFDWLRIEAGCDQWIERSGGSGLYADAITRNFPDARFIHLHRNGADCIRSMAKHHAYRLAVIDRMFYLACRTTPYLNFGEPTKGRVPDELSGLHPLSFSRDAYDAFVPPGELLATLWTAAIVNTTRALARVPSSQVMSLDYAEIASSPAAARDRARTFMDRASTPSSASGLQTQRATRDSGPRGPSDRVSRILARGERALATMGPARSS